MLLTGGATTPVANGIGRVEAEGVKPSDWTAESSFRAFVEQSTAQLLAYLRPVVRDSDGVDAEDALQEALIRLAREWKELPADPASRKNYIYRALRCSAIDAMRKWSGRGSARGRTYAADVELAERVDHLDGAGGLRDPELASIGRAIYRDATRRDEADQTVLRSTLVAALAALKPIEAQVIFGLAGSATREELAAELGVDTNRVRNVAQEARDVLRPLILHANGASLGAGERERLFRYLDGDLRGRERRLVKRHLAHCGTCREIAALERGVGEAGARLVLPLPALGAAAQGMAALAVGSAAAGLPSAGGLGMSGAFAGAGSKLATGLATVLVVGAGGAAVMEQHPASRRHTRSKAPAAASAARRHTPPASSATARSVPHAPTVRAHAPSRTELAERNPAPAPTHTTSPPAPHTTASGPANPQQHPTAPTESGNGGEFVIGG